MAAEAVDDDQATDADATAEQQEARTPQPERVVHFNTIAHDIHVTDSTLTDDELRDSLQRFRRNLRGFERRGLHASVIIERMDTGARLDYNADERTRRHGAGRCLAGCVPRRGHPRGVR